MPETQLVTWRQLTGNKFRKDLTPEMFSSDGCIKLQRFKQIGAVERSTFNVTYDREYGIEMLLRKVCRPLAPLGRRKVLELVNEAFDLHEKQSNGGTVGVTPTS